MSLLNTVDKFKLGREYDHRIKLNDAQKQEIRYKHNLGVSVTDLAREYDVTYKLITLIINPEKYQQVLDDNRVRNKYKKYKDSRGQKEADAKYRMHKLEVLLKKTEEANVLASTNNV